MKEDISYGAIVWRNGYEGPEFLVLRRSDNHIWEPPKGHGHEGETEEVAAKRELREELGITDCVFEKGFREVWQYVSSKKIKRKFIFFLTHAETIRLSDEHDDFVWSTVKNLSEYYNFEDIIRVYREAEKFIKTNIK